MIPTHKIAIEIQGGVFARKIGEDGKAIKMGHNSGTGITRDCEKFIEAQINGWVVFPVPTHKLKAWMSKLIQLINKREGF